MTSMTFGEIGGTLFSDISKVDRGPLDRKNVVETIIGK